MFLTRISSDAVVHQPRFDQDAWAGIRFPNDLWFRTADALRRARPNDWHLRFDASLLLFRWEAANTVAAAALIADDETLLALPGVPENVRAAARRFSDCVSPADAARTGETWTLIYRLAQITTFARAAFETYADTGTIPAELSLGGDHSRRIKDWQRFLDELYAAHEVRNDVWSPFAVAYRAARDAVDRLADVVMPEAAAPCWRVAICPEDRADFFRRAVHPAGLTYAEDGDAIVLRAPRLPRVVAVRLMDGIAAAFPHLTFSLTDADPALRFFGGPASEKDEADTPAKLEPLFYAENVNPVPALLASPEAHTETAFRLTADTPTVLEAFLKNVVPLFHFETARDAAADRPALFVRARHLPLTAVRSLMRHLQARFPALTFETVPISAIPPFFQATPKVEVESDVEPHPLETPRSPLWEAELTARFKALDDPVKKRLYLTPAREATDEDFEDIFASDGPYLAVTFNATVERRPDGRLFYNVDALPGRRELLDTIRRLAPGAVIHPEVTLTAALRASDEALRHGDEGGFCVVLAPADLRRLKRLLTDEAGDSLDERFTVAFCPAKPNVRPRYTSSIDARPRTISTSPERP